MTRFFRLFLRPAWAAFLLVLLSDHSRAHAGEFRFEFPRPTLDRWMYPYNTTPGCRPSAPVFGSLGDESGVDSRHGQFLLGFDLIAQTVTNCEVVSTLPTLLATHRGAANYLLRRARLTVTVNRDQTFRYDPTPDVYSSFFPTNAPAFIPDTDPGRPIELFGAGYRNGWEAATFWEDGPFGSGAPGQRNAFATGYDTTGALVDVGNNVGKTNAAFAPFEVHPFAVGTTTNVVPGDFVPAGTQLIFDLNLADPLVRQYVQEGLNAGRLRFMITSLHESEFGKPPTWPDFFTRDSLVGDPPTLELEGTLVEPTDTDGDGLPDDWERFYFGGLRHSGDEDSDVDGARNADEFAAGSDPTDAASHFAIASIANEPAVPFTLRFPYFASHPSAVEWSPDARSWNSIPNPALRFYEQPGLVEWRDEIEGAAEPARFYRLRVP